MAGRRRTGALAAGLNVVSGAIQTDTERRLKREESDREFERKWQQAMTEAAVSSGQLVPQFSTQAGRMPQLTGFQQGQPMNIQSLLMGQGGQGGQPGLGGFDASGYKVDFDFGPGGQLKGYSLKRKEPKERLQEEILATSQAPTSAFIPQARAQLQETLPQTPFVPGPAGGFITSRQPLQEGANFAPGSLVGRDQVVAGLAPGLAPQLQTQRIQGLLQQGQQAGLLESPMQNVTILPREGAPRTLQVPRGQIRTEAELSETEQFRRDLQDGIQAVQAGRISKKEALRRLLEAYPDKANVILDLKQSIF